MAFVENFIGLNGNKVVNQFVVTTPKYKYFQSYDSIIARITRYGGKETIHVSTRWDYSNTTRKYFYKFIRENTKYTKLHSKKEVLALIKSGAIVVDLSYSQVA